HGPRPSVESGPRSRPGRGASGRRAAAGARPPRRSRISRALAELIPPARDRLLRSPDQLAGEIGERRAGLVEIETKIMGALGATRADVAGLHRRYPQTREWAALLPEGLEALKGRVLEVHRSTKREISASRTLNRKDKKSSGQG